MKLFFFLYLTILSSFSIFSQNTIDKTVYFDSIWKETTESNYQYYRIIKDYNSVKDLYAIYDYYKSGVLQMEGYSKAKDNLIKEGKFIFYYENGKKKTLLNYSNSKLVGKYKQWYENGTKKIEGEYFESQNNISNDYKLNQFWNSEGKQTVMDGNGFYEEINEKSSESGNIKEGLKEGTWKGEYDDRKRKYIETYKNGELITGVSTDENGIQYNYTEFENRPEPKKGIQHFYNYIGNNFKYPKKYNYIKGKIITQFIIDKEGKIVEPKTVKSVDETLDQEAIRVITSYENWIPGKQRGQYVRVLYAIPISLEGFK